MYIIRQHLLSFERSCRFCFRQTLNCHKFVNIAAGLTKVLPTHSAATTKAHIYGLAPLLQYKYTLMRELRLPRATAGPRDHVAPKISPISSKPAEL